MRKRSCSALGFVAAMLVAIPGQHLFAQGGEGGRPATVSIRVAQKVILPGDLVEIELAEIRDGGGIPSHPDYRIYLEAAEGQITGGETVTDLADFQKAAFFVGEGTVQAWYRAPYVCPETPRDLLTVLSEMRPAAPSQPLTEWFPAQRIGERRLELNCPTYALLKYTDYFESKYTSESSLVDLSVVVRLTLASVGDAQDILRIESVEVLSFSGRTRYQYRDERPEIQRLSSAQPARHGKTVRLHRDAESGKITAVEVPLISVGLGWSGSGGVPPDVLDIQPVTRQDESEEARWERMADNLEKVVDRAEEGNLESYGQVMRGFSVLMEARLLPDNEVRQGDGISYCAGQGDWEEREAETVARKSYKWELFLSDGEG